MDKATALQNLMRDARADRGSDKTAMRAVKSCRALGLTVAETRAVLSWLDYCDRDGTPYRPHAATWDRVRAILAKWETQDAKAEL